MSRNMEKERIAIIVADSNGCFPVPAVKGGAVQQLIENLIDSNELHKLYDITVFSYYDEVAKKKSVNYKNTEFKWINCPKIIKILDKLFIVFFRLVFRNKKTISFNNFFSLIYYIFVAAFYLNFNTFDKLIIENNIPLAWIIRLSRYKGEFYYHLHNVPRVNCFCKNVFERCSGFLCVSNYVANEIQNKKSPIGSIPIEKCGVLYNTVDSRLFRPYSLEMINRLKDEYNIKSHEKIVLFAGRISEEKGLHILIEALKNQSSLITLVVVGSLMHGKNSKDEYCNKVSKMIKELPGKVVFTGYIEQEKMPLFYNMADVTVLPSVWDEPAGLTMVESLMCGTPTITTYSGGIPEYVADNAILVERNEELTKNISKAISTEIFKEKIYNNNEYNDFVAKNSSDDYIRKLKDTLGGLTGEA